MKRVIPFWIGVALTALCYCAALIGSPFVAFAAADALMRASAAPALLLLATLGALVGHALLFAWIGRAVERRSAPAQPIEPAPSE